METQTNQWCGAVVAKKNEETKKTQWFRFIVDGKSDKNKKNKHNGLVKMKIQQIWFRRRLDGK